MIEAIALAGLKYYLDYSTYDETSKLCAVQAAGVNDIGMQEEVHEADAMIKNMKWAEEVTKKRQASASIAKILQSQSRFGMAVQLGSGKWALLSGHVLCPLQVMAKNSTEVLVQCLHQNDSVPQCSLRFSEQCRGVACDQASYYLRAESNKTEVRGGAWMSMVLPCDVHIVSSTYHRCFEHLLPQHTPGLAHAALGLRSSSAMIVFRSCIKAVVDSKLKLCAGPPPPGATEYKLEVLRALGCSVTDAWAKQTSLLAVLNGDWRNHSRLEYYVDRPGGIG